MPRIIAKLLLTFACLHSATGQATWFEASGQAAIIGGESDIARQQATEEAIKQALLFAGASVRSVQHMANGLLQQDSFEIRAGGEVRSIELIDEIYSGDVVTVSIRADIFPQETLCAAADYQKTLTTTWFTPANPLQSQIGGMQDFGKILPVHLQNSMMGMSPHTRVEATAPFYLTQGHNLPAQTRPQDIRSIASQYGSQYVITGTIRDLSYQAAESTGLAFWKDSFANRQLTVDIALFDGQEGNLIFEKRYDTRAVWEFDKHQAVDLQSAEFWQSAYGLAVSKLLANAASDLDEAVSCQPSYGRVLRVDNQQMTIDIGKDIGVRKGDQLTLLQVNQFQAPNGQLLSSYQIHPTRVKVTQLFADSAIVEAVDGSLLANIQPNDLVARR